MNPIGNPVSNSLLVRATPRVRLLTGFLLFMAIIASPIGTWPGLAGALLTVAICMAVTSALRPMLKAFALGTFMFAPFIFLTPLIANQPETTTHFAIFFGRLASSWSIFAKGVLGLTITTATAQTLSTASFGQALRGLHLPVSIAAILVQVVHQTGMLLDETRRMADAIAVRRGHGRPIWTLALTMPIAWLISNAQTAHRVADAMELRGMTADWLAEPFAGRETMFDVFMITGSVLMIALAITTRFMT